MASFSSNNTALKCQFKGIKLVEGEKEVEEVLEIFRVSGKNVEQHFENIFKSL